MRSPIRALAVAIATASALMLSACAGLPTSGPVNPGLPLEGDTRPPDISLIADPPQPGATPQEIVEGFIRAGSGTRGEWATAREYLTAEARETWDPSANVTIDDFSQREYVDAGDDTIVLNVTAQATVDEVGAYDDLGGDDLELRFGLAQEDGQWRISEAPNGIVLDDARFDVVFRSYALAYFDPTWTYLVPDVRWFTTTNPATSVASALLESGPSPWLSGAVATAVPEDVTLAARTVPVRDDGTAQVELTPGALDLDRETLDRVQTQLLESLVGAGVTAVQLTVDGQPLPASRVETRSTRVPPQPLVLVEEGFGFLSGDALEPIGELSEAIVDAGPTAVQVSADQDAAALLRGTGAVARADAATGWADVDTRPDLIAPTIDTGGWVWSVPRSQPQALRAFGPEGASVDVAAAWPDATRISSMEVSRDGTRVAAVVSDGGPPTVWVAGVIRDGGVPVRLGEPWMLGSLPGTGTDMAWLDATHVGIVSDVAGDTNLVEQLVGGPADIVTAPAAITTIAPTNQAFVPRLLDARGVLYVRRGTNWGNAAADVPVLVLATVQGTPG
ncbi:LpqB family beta-propeller domain-containing protein [Microbacterium sp. zg.Y625]|uniref:GerMN domain-containing protein n=1 Tax=Microbacterium jiangjiandongii TaxID=3049071 RepID=UPI00214C2228|nr:MULTISPECIES: LpqB family beta-propeller domain-containing protein [unclassified Microbacterium]MCR2793784.1 LpqB family beta-propeller domain-containing protein [Microbacterium sp. zg.Y625]WIM26125.1 LpqB family beta-propeller domain-containing protein [Microbacterium sp. zg-Y625]